MTTYTSIFTFVMITYAFLKQNRRAEAPVTNKCRLLRLARVSNIPLTLNYNTSTSSRYLQNCLFSFFLTFTQKNRIVRFLVMYQCHVQFCWTEQTIHQPSIYCTYNMFKGNYNPRASSRELRGIKHGRLGRLQRRGLEANKTELNWRGR